LLSQTPETSGFKIVCASEKAFANINQKFFSKQGIEKKSTKKIGECLADEAQKKGR